MWGELDGLEQEQVELFELIVEASRSVSREQRHPFILRKTMGPSVRVQGNGLTKRVVDGDIETLTERGVLSVMSYHSSGSGFNFLVSPEGFAAYEKRRNAVDSQTENIEEVVSLHLKSEAFRTAHPKSFEKWSGASELLWHSDSEKELTTIGHKCREALQLFADELVAEEELVGEEPNVQKTINRIQAVVNARKHDLGDTKVDFLEALVTYWRAVNGLTQRQEHAGQREGEQLNWEDGRRLVFQTAILMFEIDRAMASLPTS